MRRLTLPALLGMVLLSSDAVAALLPGKIGVCSETFVKEINYRLASVDANEVYIPVPGSGSSSTFTNGGYQVSYETVGAIHRSRDEGINEIFMTI